MAAQPPNHNQIWAETGMRDSETKAEQLWNIVSTRTVPCDSCKDRQGWDWGGLEGTDDKGFTVLHGLETNPAPQL